MSKEVFGEYAAFDSGKGIRYQKNNKLVSESAVPPEVVAYLNNKLNSQPQDTAKPEPPTPTAKFPRPSEEELAKMRAESVKPAPGLELTPEEEAQRAVVPPPSPEVPVEQPPLDEGDFDDPQGYEPPTAVNTPSLPNHATIHADVSDEVRKHVEEHTPDYHEGFADASEAASPQIDPDYMEQVSIYTAGIKDIAQALYDRFGIYTIWLNVTPQTDEVNPLTGEAFTRYHQGIAYQALVKARGSGFFNRPAEAGRDAMVEGRVAHENYMGNAGDPRLSGVIAEPDATQADPSSFAHRTSPAANKEAQTHYISHEPDPVTGEMRAVQRAIPNAAQHSGKVNNSRQRFDANQDEMIVEPQFGQQVIRPNW